jgi:hypothetical protein
VPARPGTTGSRRIDKANSSSTKPTYHSESDRDAIDHVKIIDGVETSQRSSEWQHVSVCELHNHADRFRVRRHSGKIVDGSDLLVRSRLPSLEHQSQNEVSCSRRRARRA